MSSRLPAHVRDPHVHDDSDARTEAVLEQLRAAGGRITSGRRAIVASLFTAPDHHLTADDIAETVQTSHPDVALSTVYRTLETLEGLGIVARVDLGQGRGVFHLVDHVHHHLVCDECGDVVEVPHTLVDPLAADVDARYGFAVSRQRLTLTGRCRRCRR